MGGANHQKVVCFDTNVIIWGIKKEATENRIHMIERAQNLISECDKPDIKVIIPSIVLGEVLSGCISDKRAQLLSEMQRRFIIVPYDALSALYFAEMWRNREKLKIGNDGESIKITRNELKADFMIIATARAHRADYIYTSEVDVFRKFAQGKIDVRDLPGFTKQLEIYT